MPTADLRDRLVAGASDVFYRDGIAATGVAALSKEVRISKRTMYELFDSKDELVAAALTLQDELTRAALLGSAERTSDDPRDDEREAPDGPSRIDTAPARRSRVPAHPSTAWPGRHAGAPGAHA